MQEIPRLEQLIGEKVSEYLRFLGELEHHGELYVAYSEDQRQLGYFYEVKAYLGQWSTKTNKPHGRGILVCKNGDIVIQYCN